MAEVHSRSHAKCLPVSDDFSVEFTVIQKPAIQTNTAISIVACVNLWQSRPGSLSPFDHNLVLYRTV